MPTIARGLVGRTHRLIRVPSKAGAVAVAVECFVIRSADGTGNRPVELAARRQPIDREQLPMLGRGNLPWVELVSRVEGDLDGLQARIKRTEEARREL